MQPGDTSIADQLKHDIDSVRSDLQEIIKKVSFSSLRDEAAELESRIANFPMRIQRLRERKYAFSKSLESQAREFQNQWNLKRGQVQNQISLQASSLQAQLRPLETRIASISLGSTSVIGSENPSK